MVASRITIRFRMCLCSDLARLSPGQKMFATIVGFHSYLRCRGVGVVFPLRFLFNRCHYIVRCSDCDGSRMMLIHVTIVVKDQNKHLNSTLERWVSRRRPITRILASPDG